MLAETTDGVDVPQCDARTLIPGTGWRDMALVLVLVLAITWPLQRAGGDFWIADQIFRWEGGRWALRDAWLASTLLHTAGRQLGILVWLLLAVAWSVSRRACVPAIWRNSLAYVLTSALFASLLIILLKHNSGVDCPWDLLRYGGEHTYIAPLSLSKIGTGICFPSGHAAVGYAWAAIAFAMSHIRPEWRVRAMAIALSVGMTFGIVQQLRGAHFLSHDLWALAICWLVAALLARFWRWDISPIAPSRHGSPR